MWRIYFNRGEDAPQIWSIDQGSTSSEINVQGVLIAPELEVRTNADLEAEYPSPKAWLEIDGATLELEAGYAVFRKR